MPEYIIITNVIPGILFVCLFVLMGCGVIGIFLVIKGRFWKKKITNMNYEELCKMADKMGVYREDLKNA